MTRMPLVLSALAALTTLSACAGLPGAAPSPTAGPISAVAGEVEGEVETYSFTPCGDAATICSDGDTGTLATVGGETVITGLYGTRVFRLSPGGSGTVELNGTAYPLAWGVDTAAVIAANAAS